MALLRFVISLALRAVLGLAGLAIAAYGATFVIGSAYLLSQMWGGLKEAGDLPPVTFLLQHYGLYGGLILLGGAMVVLAIRGAIAHIRAGLPSEEEGIGQSRVSRLLNALIYGAGFCFGVFSIAVSIVPGTQMAILVANGVTAQATVLSYEATSVTGVWNMRYQFTTKSGQVITDVMPTEPVTEKPSMNLYASGIEMTYLESDPAQHAITQFYSHSSFVFFMVTRLLIALVGLWGLIKNLSPAPPKGDTATVPPTRMVTTNRFAGASAPPVRRSAAGSPGERRATFGRRGA